MSLKTEYRTQKTGVRATSVSEWVKTVDEG